VSDPVVEAGAAVCVEGAAVTGARGAAAAGVAAATAITKQTLVIVTFTRMIEFLPFAMTLSVTRDWLEPSAISSPESSVS
jgi:hypothetical protein